MGAVAWHESQAIYHAMAQLRQEGLVICRPDSRCICLGLHDDLQQEVDEEYCRQKGIPIIRREIGGGPVLLDVGQIFFQLVLRCGHPLLSGRRDQFFTSFLAPVIKTLGDFGIEAAVKPPADISVKGRKISGNGAGDINGCAVYTGNLLLAFDRRTMARSLRLPGSRFRELTLRSMERNLTTMEEELGSLPSSEAVEERLIANFSTWLPALESAVYSTELQETVKQVAAGLTDREFLELPGRRSRMRQVKINEGTYLYFQSFGLRREEACPDRYRQACGGFASITVQEGFIREVEIAGVPCMTEVSGASLAPYLLGAPWERDPLSAAIKDWQARYRRMGQGPDHEIIVRCLLGK